MQIFADKKFENPIEVIKAFDKKSFIEAFAKIETYRKTHYLLGYVRYEAKDIFSNKSSLLPLWEKVGEARMRGVPLLYFEVFENYQSYAPEAAATIRLEKNAQIDYATYEKAIDEIKKEISNGNTYQVNYTYDWQITSDIGGIALYESILGNQKTPYNAYIKNEFEEILSFSPELFFELEGNIIKTKPMKGTVQRGKTEAEDQKNIEFLKNDIKNRAENVMIVDLLRNDLGKIAKTGSVKVDKLFEVETHKTVHQMTSGVTAELEENITMYDIFEALFPCGSVTGAPKINTMKIIDELEVGKRNVYCGAIGLISPEKTIFSVPIRILQRRLKSEKDNAMLKQVQDEVICRHCERSEAIQKLPSYICRVGGAIVWDSTAKDEWQETLTKIQFLENLTRHPELVSGSQNLLINNSCPNPAIPKRVRNDVTSDKFELVETIKVENGKMNYKKEHFKRLKDSAKDLGFKFNPDILKINPSPPTPLPQGARVVDTNNLHILRILLSKEGVFETQYLPIEEPKTNKISVSKTPVNSKEPLLYHKTTYRPWYDASAGVQSEKTCEPARLCRTQLNISDVRVCEANSTGANAAAERIKNGEIFDEIFFNEKGELTEGSRTNIILQLDGKLYTPPVECGILNGILRQKLLSIGFKHPSPQPSPSRGEGAEPVCEKKLHLNDLNRAEKIFCINSVRGILEVEL